MPDPPFETFLTSHGLNVLRQKVCHILMQNWIFVILVYTYIKVRPRVKSQNYQSVLSKVSLKQVSHNKLALKSIFGVTFVQAAFVSYFLGVTMLSSSAQPTL